MPSSFPSSGYANTSPTLNAASEESGPLEKHGEGIGKKTIALSSIEILGGTQPYAYISVIDAGL